MSEPKILTLDVERFPNIVHKWSLFDKHPTPLSMVERFGSTVSFAAKWYDKNKVEFYSDFHHGHYRMIEHACRLLDEADIVITYNGDRFDLPHLRKEMVVEGFAPHSPVLSVDLLKVARRFNFESRKLDHVAQQLGVGSKVKHSGHDLWKRCMVALDHLGSGDVHQLTPEDEKAWNLFKRYNIGDVRLTEKVYDRLRPWITGHPHMGLFLDLESCCQRCGSTDLERRGYAYTPLGKFQQYRCNAQGCGAWSRGRKAIAMVDERGTA